MGAVVMTKGLTMGCCRWLGEPNAGWLGGWAALIRPCCQNGDRRQEQVW